MAVGDFDPRDAGMEWSPAGGWHRGAGGVTSGSWYYPAGRAGFEPDPDYDIVKETRAGKRGVQCGRCGMKFDYNQAYGYYCADIGCPVQPKAT